jgi:hypothetical protein
MNCGQKGTDQRQQKVNFHVLLRRMIAAQARTAFHQFNDSHEIKNG